MNCDRSRRLIGDAIDGTLDAATQAALTDHLSACAECRGVRADLHRIRSLAATLEPLSPPASTWPGIAAALDAEASRSWRAWLSWRIRLAPATVAAAVLVVMAAGTWAVWSRMSPGPAPQSVASARAAESAKAAATAESEIQQAEEHYNKAIAMLEQATENSSGALDAQTTAVLQNNLGVIDGAIGESRQALHADPSNEVARQSLFDALRSKVALLEDTVALINEMRKGNQEGAARIVSGMKP